jgi:hypothetical protein
MATHEKLSRRKISRRTWLKGMMVFSAAAVLASTVAQAKASKAAVHYQDHPNATMRMCQTCKFFISVGGGRSGMMGCPMGGGMMGRGMMRAGACQLVEGRISPMGYCDLYAPGGA